MKSFSVLWLAAVIGSALHAGTIVYDSLAGASAGVDCVNGGNSNCPDPGQGPLYDSFSTGSAGQIIDLQLILNGNNDSSGTLDIGLYADSSTSPGSLIDLLGTISDSSLSSSLATYDITLTAFPSLAADTRYWIGLSGTTSAGWSWTASNSGTGVSTEFIYDHVGGVGSTSNGPWQMQVTMGTEAASAPEPGSVFLAAAGLAALGLLCLRERLIRL